MEPLLRIVEELERRDEEAAAALQEVERLQAAVLDLRREAGTTASYLAGVPAALAAREAEVQAAEEARLAAESRPRDAEATLERARKDDERLAAARAVQHARDELREAELRLEQARRELEQLEREGEERRAQTTRLEARAVELASAPRLAGETPPPEEGLDGVLEWTSRARGALLLVHAALVDERDRIVREATELVAGVLGEPLVATGVAGARDRLARSLQGA